MDRRRFSQGLGGAVAMLGAGVRFGRSTAVGHETGSLEVLEQTPALNTKVWPIAIFEKVFEGLDFGELADAVAETGADGIEATIRPGGHIEPERAADLVPKMAEALKKRGCSILIAATQIDSVDNPFAESLLRTLKDSGVDYYRMGYYWLDVNRPGLPQLESAASKARELAALNAEIGIQGLYQNHSAGGDRNRVYLGALGWDAAWILKNIPPEHLGVAMDTRHLKQETGTSWRSAVIACKPHIRSIYLKDGVWEGERSERVRGVPLDEGFVDLSVFNFIRAGLEPMPLCLHMEWLGYRIFPKSEIPDAIQAHRKDIATIRRWLDS